MDICASELIPPPRACTGAPRGRGGRAIRARAYVCARESAKERGDGKGMRAKVDGGGRREREKQGMTGVSSRAGEITHFDGIKMSVFPTPISAGR